MVAVVVSCCTSVRMMTYAEQNIMRDSTLTPVAQCVPVWMYEVRVVHRPLDNILGFGGLDVFSHVFYREFFLLCKQGCQTRVFYLPESVDLG